MERERFGKTEISFKVLTDPETPIADKVVIGAVITYIYGLQLRMDLTKGKVSLDEIQSLRSKLDEEYPEGGQMVQDIKDSYMKILNSGIEIGEKVND